MTCQWCSVNSSAIENSMYYEVCYLVLNKIFNQSINRESINISMYFKQLDSLDSNYFGFTRLPHPRPLQS